MEMQWLREHGVIASLADYLALPQGVLDDCLLIMEAERQARRMAAQDAAGRRA